MPHPRQATSRDSVSMSCSARAARGRCLELEVSLLAAPAQETSASTTHSNCSTNCFPSPGLPQFSRSTSCLLLSLVLHVGAPKHRDFFYRARPDMFTYSILICCLCCTGRLELGFAAFGLILKTGWRFNGMVINQLPNGLCDAKRVGEAMDIMMRQMPEFSCTPDVFSYNRIIKGFCNERRVEEALELLRMMADDGGRRCSPSVVSYTTVLNGFFGEGQVDTAYSLFLEMMDRWISPNVVTYNTIIHGQCKAQAVDRAEGVFQQMIRDGVKPNIKTYNCLIHGYCLSCIASGERSCASLFFKPSTLIQRYTSLLCVRQKKDMPHNFHLRNAEN
ncbi:hypothetical protein BS78_05G046300 [Paspalum vaginatum]|nr:hypothetical protein BS78_05G046300 [Paspalum vaginatum]